MTDIESVLRLCAGLFALQDVILFVYLTLIGAMVWYAPAGPAQGWCARRIYVAMAMLLIGCFASRGLPQLSPRFRALLYRVALAVVTISNYLMLRELLPLVRPDAVDDVLVRIDLRIFGVEPALWLEQYNRPPIIEWFSFFYFSYFSICLLYMLVMVWLTRPGKETTEYAIGTLTIFCIGQLTYIAVPGYGPLYFLADHFRGPIIGGFFWSCIERAVEAGSAVKDIFPSLHTAIPLWYTLFAVHRAKVDRRWRWPAIITGFFSANIILSTMLLRWHYAIDVVAGIALATTTSFLAPKLAEWEHRWRQSLGYLAPWSFEGNRGNVGTVEDSSATLR